MELAPLLVVAWWPATGFQTVSIPQNPRARLPAGPGGDLPFLRVSAGGAERGPEPGEQLLAPGVWTAGISAHPRLHHAGGSIGIFWLIALLILAVGCRLQNGTQ